jgi:predicted AlkP superfamily pyrophosphatase or phosphodiesterase
MFDPADAAMVFWTGEFTQIFPKRGKEDRIYESIRRDLPSTAKIYRKSDLPRRYRLSKANRLAPLIVLPESGTVITNKERYEKAEREGTLDRTRGGHGYDNQHPLMRATFIGYGPNFKSGYVSDPFESVDVYNLMAKILGLKPAKNDGKFSRIKSVLR